ncbi:Multicopper oxidase with three cupredoxin domains (Includes cell division protein FtsP and spore coat protein CotA) OS=Bosea thiooxidans OX=53254 GN=SAMN05660750_01595 PE=4 SV=1 [Bosea thiooxidans]|uniref:Multicopper oxidase with three cupredoxin domains (Includes cell division protein FtsP and spore coat protein CotA) n=2 Tax=Bosea thiooxidans TaxID=53254 RepID=A0A1T5CSF2_9HYPH|nr:multicopper oxidase family protein [Bosea thiooxidans]SKB62263.1 Multicopper oxidase with three cupredoxin domains (includes cell division protein FtsP and spore coat protein CotA) [Bosea thiooxidans]
MGMTMLRSTRPALLSRRHLLAGIGGAAVLSSAGSLAQTPAEMPKAQPGPLTAAPTRTRLRPAPAPDTEIWAFDGANPAPSLRIKQGETLSLKLENRTTAPLGLHCYGLRGEAVRDGVGGFTQPPIAPGETGEIRLTPPDSGTLLYRPLVLGASSEPCGRGLGGLIVVEEKEPLGVDLDLPVLVSDWLLGDDQSIQPFVLQGQAGASVGRLGSWVTVNRRSPPAPITARPGARVRLRLANACNARIMRLRFDGGQPTVIAVDSQPTESFAPVRSQLPFAPGTRYDVVLDLPVEDGAAVNVTALIGGGLPLVRIVTAGEPQVPRAAMPALKLNPALPLGVRMQDALRPEIVVEGGATLGDDQKLDFSGVDLAKPWRINGGVGSLESKPLFSVKRGTPIVMAIDNRTAFVQPFHVHGHSFRLLHPLDDGWENYFLDTVQIPERKKLHIAFIADNPGRWLISSTVLERFDLGLWSWFEVT